MHDLDRQQLEQYERAGLFGQPETGEFGAELSEAQEMALAAEILEISSEEELEEFLKDFWNRAASTARAAWRSDAARDLVSSAKQVGKVMLPIGTGIAVERHFPGYGPWAAGATKLLADQVLKEELEGLSGEDREFEIARRFARFLNDTMRRAAQAPPRVPPPVAAQVAIAESAREHLPGLVPFLHQILTPQPSGGSPNGASGRWVRRGSSIVIDLG